MGQELQVFTGKVLEKNIRDQRARQAYRGLQILGLETRCRATVGPGIGFSNTASITALHVSKSRIHFFKDEWSPTGQPNVLCTRSSTEHGYLVFRVLPICCPETSRTPGASAEVRQIPPTSRLTRPMAEHQNSLSTSTYH